MGLPIEGVEGFLGLRKAVLRQTAIPAKTPLLYYGTPPISHDNELIGQCVLCSIIEMRLAKYHPFR